MFEYGQAVKIKNKDGKLVNAKLLNKTDYFKDQWWTEYHVDGFREVSIFDEKDLIVWMDYSCKCGSTTAGQSNRHAYYCDLYENY